MLTDDNKIVNGLWIGKSLTAIELLCITSFIKNGHEFHLWAYDQIETLLPDGTVLEDASTIIPREQVFCYKYSNQFGHGKGSYAGFSDVFRYKLLYEHGGWWVDMDVTCLKSFDFEDPYVFRNHHDLPVVGNMMKCPRNSELMRLCYEQAREQVDENNTDWHKPIQILNDHIVKLGLAHHIKELSNHDKWNDVRKLLYKNIKLPDNWYAIHWINEEWRRNNINKNIFYQGSTISELYKKYMGNDKETIVPMPFKEKIKLVFFGAAFIQIKARIAGFISKF